MADIFAFAESRGGALRKVALEAVSAARHAADATGGGEVHALLIGAPGIGEKAAALGRAGADVVVVVEHAELARYSPEVFAATAAARLRAGGYRAAFFAASAEGRDLAPRVAAALDVRMASDLTGFALEGDALVGQHPTHIGKIITTVRLTGTPARRHAPPRRDRRGGCGPHAARRAGARPRSSPAPRAWWSRPSAPRATRSSTWPTRR